MNMRVLESIKLFAKLSADEKSRVIRQFKLESYAVGANIVKEGDKGTTFYILKDGTAKVVSNGATIVELATGMQIM